jgi:hypothetical protein
MMFHEKPGKITNNMTIKESTKELIHYLLEETKQGRVEWKSTIPNQVFLQLSDVKFDFAIHWSLDLEKGWQSSDGYLNIKSKTLNFTVYKSTMPEEIEQFKSLFFEKFFESHKPKNQDVINEIEDLKKQVSLEAYRSNKIDKIFEE